MPRESARLRCVSSLHQMFTQKFLRDASSMPFKHLFVYPVLSLICLKNVIQVSWSNNLNLVSKTPEHKKTLFIPCVSSSIFKCFHFVILSCIFVLLNLRVIINFLQEWEHKRKKGQVSNNRNDVSQFFCK